MNTTTSQLWNEYHGKLHAFIAHRVGNADAANDILQDVFLKTHTRLADVREETKLRSWLYQIARNAVSDYFRERRVTSEVVDLPEESGDAGQHAVRELAECLRPMIDSLPDNYRDALVLAELDGLSQRVIAEREGISLSGAKSRVQRARAMLKTVLDDCCRFEFDMRGHLVGFQPNACDDSCDGC